MNTAQKEYLTGTTGGDISLVTWAKLSEKRTADEMDREWTGGVACLNTLGEDGERSYRRFRKLSQSQRMKYWEEALQARDLKRGADGIESGDQNRKSNKEPKVKHHNNSRPIRASHASTSTTTPASPSPSPSSSSSAPKPHATTPSSIPATDKDRVFDITKRLECTKDGFDVGAAFLMLQQEASPTVNNRQQKLTLTNFHQFM
ncbi:hypothetical protein BGZ65_003033 [Modicella reniformis]|uniref:Uncharacterized protein n=1 Tax=Modicella reniformis TaxID=1440133 RepID=A0A9P6J654_9FUNG|nr:hypothetical protein BGZ65_003033 [Modicella reniformis]